jgi:hypothetical protein
VRARGLAGDAAMDLELLVKIEGENVCGYRAGRAPSRKKILCGRIPRNPSLGHQAWCPQRSMRMRWHVFSLGPAWVGVKSTPFDHRLSVSETAAIA